MSEKVNILLNGGVAQLGEHLPCKQGVKSSNLSVSICRKASMYLEKSIQRHDKDITSTNRTQSIVLDNVTKTFISMGDHAARRRQRYAAGAGRRARAQD